MMNTKLLLSALLLTGFSLSLSAQTTESCLLFDAACMKKYDYERSSEYYDLPFWDFHVAVSAQQTLIFRVLKQDIYQDEAATLDKEPMRCTDTKQLNTAFVADINTAKKTMTIAEYDKARKMYKLYAVKEVLQYFETSPAIKYMGSNYLFTFNKANTKVGVNIDSAGGRVMYEAKSKLSCYAQYQFRAYPKKEIRVHENLFFADNIGLVKVTKEKGSLELKYINGVAINDYLKQKCANAVATPNPKVDTASIVKVNPKDPKNTGSTIDNPFGKPTGKVTADTNKVMTEPGTVGKDGYYVVAEGDNLYKIAKKFNTRIDVIVGLNNLKNMNIDRGQRLKVVDDGTYKDANPIERTDEATGVKSKVHVVRQGENLWEIARRYNTTTTQIQKLNNMNTDKIDVRQELIIEIIK